MSINSTKKIQITIIDLEISIGQDTRTGRSLKLCSTNFTNSEDRRKMEARELTDITLAKCEHYDRGYCKEKNNCPKIHPNIICGGNCEDKRTCMKRHQIPCKNSPSCTWKSCEFSHKAENKGDVSQKNYIKENIEERITANQQIVRESHITIKEIIENNFSILTDRINTIEEEYSSKL